MEHSLINTIPSEEIKIAPINNSLTKTRTMKNPLLSNKGSAKADMNKEVEVKVNTVPSCTPPLVSSISPSVFPIIESTMVHICAAKTNKEYPLCSSIKLSFNEDCLSNLSEMNSVDRFNRLSNGFQPPLFEVRNTMLELIAKQIDQKSDSLKDEPFSPVHKARTIEAIKRSDAENMTKKLTPEEYQYFAIMNQFTENYLGRALKYNKIFNQYATLSRINRKLLQSSDFINRRRKILKQKNKYAKNTYKYHGIVIIYNR